VRRSARFPGEPLTKAAPSRNAHAAMTRPIRMPPTKADETDTSEPSTATPSTPPACRAALMTPQAADAAPKPTSPAVNTRRPPSRSASAPPVSSRAAKARV
jgi:hypothetical protein